MSAVEVRGTGESQAEALAAAMWKAEAAAGEVCRMLAEQLAMVWETIRAALRRLSVRLVDFLVEHQPRRTRSGRWRVRMPAGGVRIYRSRDLAMAALRRALIGAVS